jgi:hypothetical protein
LNEAAAIPTTARRSISFEIVTEGLLHANVLRITTADGVRVTVGKAAAPLATAPRHCW